MRTRCRLGSNRRLVATMEWLRLLPNAGPREQTWQTFGMAGEYRGGEAALAPTVRQYLHRRPRAVAACRGVSRRGENRQLTVLGDQAWVELALQRYQKAKACAGTRRFGYFYPLGGGRPGRCSGAAGVADARGGRAGPTPGGGRP